MRFRYAFAIVAAVIVAISTLLSPLILGILGNFDWRQLGDIGQAYGAASAILSALAIVGVAVGLSYQVRTLRLASLDSIRKTHGELLYRLMDDPDTYLPAVGFDWWKSSGMKPEQFYYITLFFGYMRIGVTARVFAENDLRREFLQPLFSGELGRKWWQISRNEWLGATEPAMRVIGQAAEDEYRKAIAAGEPLPETAFLSSLPKQRAAAIPTPSSGVGTLVLITAASAAVGALATWAAGRARTRRIR